MQGIDSIHLLWPSNRNKEVYADSMKATDDSYIKNLGVEQIVNEICINDTYRNDIRNLICNLCDDPEVIQYRLDIMEDFLRHPGLIQRLEKVLPIIQKLEDDKIDLYSLGADQFRKIAWQLEKLYIFVECMEEFDSIFRQYKSELKSKGLLQLASCIEGTMEDQTYQSLRKDIPKFKNQLQNMSFVTIGINLDQTLKPVEAVFLSIESKPYKKPSVLSNFLGKCFIVNQNRGEKAAISVLY